MSEEQSDFPVAWRPKPGESIRGVLLSVEMIDPSGQGRYPCVVLQKDDGSEVAVHAFHQVLRSALARRHPNRGEEVEIKYLGKKPGGKNPEGYHAYRVTGGSASDFDWSQELPEDERPQSAVPIAATPIRVMSPPASIATVVVPDVEDEDDDLPF